MIDRIVKILITGDFCPTGRSENFIKNHQTDSAFNDILPLVRGADIAVTNLECPLVENGKRIQKTGPHLKSAVETAEFLRDAGFNLVTLANNHVMDYGHEGLISTLEACSRASINYVGVGNTLDEARNILYMTVSDLKIAFINICENEWSTSQGKNYGANPVNPVTNHEDIKKAKRNSDYVFVIYHGNNEMYHLPSPRIKELFHFYVDSGADFVVCHHSHVYSGAESYNNGLIFYGLGNFLFDNGRFLNSNWNNGLIVQFNLGKESISFDLIPIRQSDKIPGVRLAQGKQIQEYQTKIKKLNQLISDDSGVEEEFHNFCNSQNNLVIYNSFIQPYSNKYLTALYKRGFLPSLMSRRKKRLLRNLMVCESHRDVLQLILIK